MHQNNNVRTTSDLNVLVEDAPCYIFPLICYGIIQIELFMKMFEIINYLWIIQAIYWFRSMIQYGLDLLDAAPPRPPMTRWTPTLRSTCGRERSACCGDGASLRRPVPPVEEYGDVNAKERLASALTRYACSTRWPLSWVTNLTPLPKMPSEFRDFTDCLYVRFMYVLINEWITLG